MDPLIERYLTRVEGMKAEATYDTVKTNLNHFNQWIEENDYEITDVDTLDLEEYFIHLNGEGYAPNTIASRFESIRGFYKALAGKFEVLDENPFADLKRGDYVEKNTKKHDESEISYVTPEEKELLCEHLPSPTLRNELVVRLLWQTGVRKSELVEIELANLDREDRCIEVWSNKTKESRSVFYQPSLDVLMDQWLDGGYRDSYAPAQESPYLFVTERSEKLHVSTVSEKIVKPAAENAGIQEKLYTDQAGNTWRRITPHALRHGHAVHALRSGIDIRTVQQHLGHADLDMTMKYLQLIDDDVKKGYQKFDHETNA